MTRAELEVALRELLYEAENLGVLRTLELVMALIDQYVAEQG